MFPTHSAVNHPYGGMYYYAGHQPPNLLQFLASQRDTVLEGLIAPKKKGDVWYLIALPWYQLWSRYVGLIGGQPGAPENHPGPIDNSSIMDNNGELLPNLDERHFMALPDGTWSSLAQYYYLSSKSPQPLPRVIVHDSKKNPVIELYRLNLTICYIVQDNEVRLKMMTVSRSVTIGTILENFQDQSVGWIGAITSTVKQKHIHFWIRNTPSAKFELQLPGKALLTLQELDVNDDAIIVLRRATSSELPSMDVCRVVMAHFGGVVEIESPPKSSLTETPTKKAATEPKIKPVKNVPSKPGICGLNNLGNTCYLNSVIQCLSNVNELRLFFTSGSNSHLTTDKERSVLSDEYAALMRSMWSGLNDTASSRDFREAFLRHAPQFSEGQQDASAFLVNLLHFLNNELSNVQTPPSVKAVVTVPSDDTAKQYWSRYKDKYKRHSLISDLFDGLLKSTLTCEVCKESVYRFEPFSCLTVPISTCQPLLVYFRPADPRRKVSYAEVMLPRRCRVSDVRLAVSQAFGIDAGRFLIAGMSVGYRFTQWYKDGELAPAGDRESVICFEANEIDNKDNVRVVVYLGSGTDKLHGLPYLLSVSREKTTELELNQRVYQLIEPLFSYANDIPVEGEHYSLMFANTDFSGEKYELHGRANFVFRNELASAKTKYLIMMWRAVCFEKFFKADAFDSVALPKQDQTGSQKDAVNLTDCFKSFLEEELLSEADAWRCMKCEKPQPALKKMDLTLLPLYLTVHLNRFQKDEWGFNKRGTFVRYPVTNLDMTPFAAIGDPPVANCYDLVAVVTHYGDINGGHYKAAAFHSLSNKWYEFNDNEVTELPSDRIVTDAAFLLIYRRRTDVKN